MVRLAEVFGNRTKSRYDNIFFIKHNQVPAVSKIAYANPVCDFRPLKDNPYRVWLTVGGYHLPYPADVGSPIASLLEAKIHFNRFNFDSWFPIYLCRYQGLFSLLPDGTLWIHQNTFMMDSERNTHPVKVIWFRRPNPLYLLQILQSYEFPKKSRSPCFRWPS